MALSPTITAVLPSGPLPSLASLLFLFDSGHVKTIPEHTYRADWGN